MKKKLIPLFLIPVIGSITLLGSCNIDEGDDPDIIDNNKDKTANLSLHYEDKTYNSDFSISVDVGSTIDRLRPEDNSNPVFSSSDENICLVDSSSGLLTPKAEGTATITAVGGKDNKTIKVTVKVNPTTLATGAYTSYASADTEERIKIMAALEDYAVENYLTGITMFSNGGYVCYSDRYTPLPNEYVAGYGWGTMREGKLDTTKAVSNEVVNKTHYQIGTSSIPETTNAMDASGSDVSDLAGYLTQSYFTTRLNSTNDGYEYVAGLADENANKQSDGKVRPWAIDQNGNKTGAAQSKRWRIYVKTGSKAPTYAMGNSGALSTTIQAKYNGRQIELEDYLTPFKFMLTNYNGQYRGSEMTTGTSGFEGAAAYFGATGTKPSDSKVWYDADAWDKYMSDNIKTGHDANGDYIDFNLLYSCTQFYAMYYLSSSLYSPLPAEFISDFGTHIGVNFEKNDATSEGRADLFASGQNTLNMVDTTLGCGPYYMNEYKTNNLLSMNRNPYYDGMTDALSDGSTRRIYQIDGFDMVKTQTSQSQNKFLDGQIDSYAPDKDALKGDFGVDSGNLTGDGITSRMWYRYKTKADATFKLNVNATTEEQWKKFFGKNGTVYPHASDSDYSKYTKFYLSNKHFLNFLSYAMDRKTICESRGMTPTQEYLSDNYLIDPENSISYNATDAHKAVLADRYNDTYGYNKTAAENEFVAVMDELITKNTKKLKSQNSTGTAGTASNPYVIDVDMSWMNETDTDTYGDVFDSITSIANDVLKNMYGGAYVFKINQQDGTSDYNAVYTKMKQGEFQLGFGAISGGDLNPLNFLEVLKSDNSSGFTLNWGPDTSVVDSENPIVYDGKKWSFDGLWNAGNSAVVLDTNGNIAGVKNASAGTGTYPRESGTKNVSVTYKLSFKDLIEAGATVTVVRFTNGEYSEEMTEDEIKTLMSSADKTYTKTFDSNYNSTGTGASKATSYMLSVVVTYSATSNGVTVSMSSTLRLPTSAGI